MKRTHRATDIGLEQAGQEVVLMGWVTSGGPWRPPFCRPSRPPPNNPGGFILRSMKMPFTWPKL
jgi:hypothetical protein